MLWPLVLPLQITFLAAVGLLIAAPLIARRRRWRRGRAFLWTLLLVLIGFVPSCGTILWAVDHFRFGVFEYPNFAAVHDFRVERYLPPAAREIKIDKYAQGFVARFRIDKTVLDDWFEQLWKVRGPQSAVARGELVVSPSVDAQHLAERLNDEPRQLPTDWVQYVGPMADNGAGFILNYSEEAGIAYQHAGYW